MVFLTSPARLACLADAGRVGGEQRRLLFERRRQGRSDALVALRADSQYNYQK